MEFIQTDVLLKQFTMCQYMNQHSNGLCESSLKYALLNWWDVALAHQHVNNWKSYLPRLFELFVAL